MHVRIRAPLWGLVGVAVAIALWQILATTADLGPTLPTPGQTLTALIQAFGLASFWLSVMNTVIVAVEGLLIGIVVGVVAGILIGVSPTLMHATRVTLEFLKPIPPIVILPLAVLVLGPSQAMAVFLIFFNTALTIVYQTASGVRETDPVTVETGRSYGMGRLEILNRIVVPSASAFIATAIRVTMPAALIVAVVAGLIGGGPGLGRDLYIASSASRFDDLYAYVIVLGLLGLFFQLLSVALEKRVLHWHPSYRPEVH